MTTKKTTPARKPANRVRRNITVTLEPGLLKFLSRASGEMTQAHASGRIVSRAEIVAALVRGIERHGIDFGAVESLDQLAEIVAGTTPVPGRRKS